MKPTREQLRDLLQQVAATQAEEIDCEEFLARVATYLEKLRAEETLASELSQVAQHLRVCPNCSEEFEALLASFE